MAIASARSEYEAAIPWLASYSACIHLNRGSWTLLQHCQIELMPSAAAGMEDQQSRAGPAGRQAIALQRCEAIMLLQLVALCDSSTQEATWNCDIVPG